MRELRGKHPSTWVFHTTSPYWKPIEHGWPGGGWYPHRVNLSKFHYLTCRKTPCFGPKKKSRGWSNKNKVIFDCLSKIYEFLVPRVLSTVWSKHTMGKITQTMRKCAWFIGDFEGFLTISRKVLSRFSWSRDQNDRKRLSEHEKSFQIGGASVLFAKYGFDRLFCHMVTFYP